MACADWPIIRTTLKEVPRPGSAQTQTQIQTQSTEHAPKALRKFSLPAHLLRGGVRVRLLSVLKKEGKKEERRRVPFGMAMRQGQGEEDPRSGSCR